MFTFLLSNFTGILAYKNIIKVHCACLKSKISFEIICVLLETKARSNNLMYCV